MGILDKIVKQNEHLATGRNSLLSLSRKEERMGKIWQLLKNKSLN